MSSSPPLSPTPSPEAAERAKIAGAATTPAVVSQATKNTINNMSPQELEDTINRILGIQKSKEASAKASASGSPEPDWTRISEREATDVTNSFNIPVIEHEVPSYMDIQLADPEYIAVWANRDQRRLGQLLAEGYELLKIEHVSPSFRIPLKWDSEGIYIYQDVIALRVHKRIAFAKRRKVVEQSITQLRGPQALAKAKLAKVIGNDSRLGEAFESGNMSYYSTEVE